MNRKKLFVIVGIIVAVVVLAVVVTVVVLVTRKDTPYSTAFSCDKQQNSDLPFCDSSLSFNKRVEDLVKRLTLDEKIGLLEDRANGAAKNIELDSYNWWNEALHGVAWNRNGGTFFRPPTEYSTVFPQIISLSTSFDRDLFFRISNATGNEAR